MFIFLATIIINALYKSIMLSIWTLIPMDMVYEILEFSNHAKLRNLVLMYKIPETDPRLQMQITPIKKKSVVLPMPN